MPNEPRFLTVDRSEFSDGDLVQYVNGKLVPYSGALPASANPASAGDGRALPVAKTIVMNAARALTMAQMAPFLEISGSLSADAPLTLPAASGLDYIVRIRNKTTGAGRLFVQKPTGPASQILRGQTARVRVRL